MCDNTNPGAGDDSRQGLYNEFESEVVKRGNTEAYFDESDLIEIFDYASDMDNYIVKMEVLLYGARHYPASEALATRRAWFYSSFGEMEAASDVNNRVSNGGFLNRLLTLRAEGASDSAETRRRLEEIVDSSAELGDEDVIQLVDFCAENRMLDWVDANRSRVEAKCSYIPTYIYEHADRAEEMGDLPTARRLFEELTMMEPFTIDFWTRLAAVQLASGDYADAMASADYALAVDDKYAEALRLKGRAMYRRGESKEAVSAIFKSILDLPDANDGDASAYAATLIELGRNEEAIEVLERTIAAYPMAQMPIDLLMNIDFARATPHILRVAREASFSRETVIAWAKEHVGNGRHDIAALIVGLFRDMFVGSPDLGFLCELWYINKMYRETVDVVEESYPDPADFDRPDPSVTFPYLMSLARLGSTNRALAFARRHLSDMERMINEQHSTGGFRGMLLPGASLSACACLDIGYTTLMRSIINAISSQSGLSPDAYDPMN